MHEPAPPQTSREGPDPVSCGAPPLWSLANHKPVLEAPPPQNSTTWIATPMEPCPTEPRPHGVPPHGAPPPWNPTNWIPTPMKPRPTEPRPHRVPPGARLRIPGASGDLEARAFLKKLLEQSKTSSLVPTPRPISPTCPANPLSLLPWVNLVPCSGDAQLQRQREQGSMRCGVSAPIPAGSTSSSTPALSSGPHPPVLPPARGDHKERE